MVDGTSSERPVVISSSGALDDWSWLHRGFDSVAWEDLLEASPVVDQVPAGADNVDYEAVTYQPPITQTEDDNIPLHHADTITIPMTNFSSLAAALDEGSYSWW